VPFSTKSGFCRDFQQVESYFSVKAAKPGNSLPSNNSIDAPPPRHKYFHYKKGHKSNLFLTFHF
ncbi:hypothetical protein, partial [Streptococcus catagoni]|uniref:hypothetical protein n=1 Tax=Streptococcus catagoni TaxID=2654874 RepID=UPI001A9E324E